MSQIKMEPEVYELLDRLIRDRYAIPAEFWLHQDEPDEVDEWTRRLRSRPRWQDRMAPEFRSRPVPRGKNVIWLMQDEERERELFLMEEPTVARAYDMRRKFMQLGIERDSGDLVWGYRYSMPGEAPTSMSYTYTSLERFASGEFFDNTVKTIDGWQDRVWEAAKEWMLLIDAAKGKEFGLPDMSAILNIRNAEMKRYLIKKVGYANIKAVLKPRVIHVDKETGAELFEILMPIDPRRGVSIDENIEPLYAMGRSDPVNFISRGRTITNGVLMRFVKVNDSTHKDREYILSVPPEMQRVRQAIAWTFRRSEKDYKPLVET